MLAFASTALLLSTMGAPLPSRGAAAGPTPDASSEGAQTVALSPSLLVGSTLLVVPPTNGSVSSGDGKIECSSDVPVCARKYVVGTSVTLTATPAYGWEFSAWTGACSATAGPTCTLSMSADRTTGAVFRFVAPGLYALTAAAYQEPVNQPPLVVDYPNVPDATATPCASLHPVSIDYDWGSGSPGRCPTEYFSIYGSGTIVAPVTGTVEFCVNSDDGMKVRIGPTFTVGVWTPHTAERTCDALAPQWLGSMEMTAGESYPLAFWYFEEGVDASMSLSWRWNGGVWTSVPGFSPATVTVDPAGAPGRVTSADGVIDCYWDGSSASGTCSDTTTATVSLTATAGDGASEPSWSGGCSQLSGRYCTADGSDTVVVTFGADCGRFGNLVGSNCGFEADLAGWTQVNEGGDTFSESHSGGRSGSLTDYWCGSRYCYPGTLAKSISVTSGRTYLVEFWQGLESGACGGCDRLEVTVSSATQSYVTYGDWTYHSFRFTATSGSALLTFRGYVDRDSGGSGLYLIDDVSVIDVVDLHVDGSTGGSVRTSDGDTCAANVPSCTIPVSRDRTLSLTARPLPGWDFLAWTGACSASTGPTCTVPMNGDRTTGARFSRRNLVSVTSGGGGSGSITSGDSRITCAVTSAIRSGACTDRSSGTITLRATPDPGSIFERWSGCDATTGELCTVSASTGDRPLVATFGSLVTLTVDPTTGGSISSGDGLIDCGADCSEVYLSGTQVTLDASAASGYRFERWTGDCSASTGPTCTVILAPDAAVGAVFSRVRRLTVDVTTGGGITSDEGAIACGATCVAEYTEGTQVTLTATASTGFVVDRWTGDCSATTGPTCTLTMDADRIANVVFVKPTAFTFGSGFGFGAASYGDVATLSVSVGNAAPAGLQTASPSPYPPTYVPTGSVTFSDGSGWSRTCTLVSGSCSVTSGDFHVGVIPINVRYGGDSYHVASSGDSLLTITPATLTVRPANKSILALSAPPTASFYTFSITGWKRGETAGTALGYVAPTCGSDYSSGAPAGTLPITCGGNPNGTAASAGDYLFDYSSATLTVGSNSVSLLYTGPTIVYYTSGTGATVALTASIAPALAGCPITFTGSGAGGPFGPVTATTNSQGVATTAAIAIPDGAYDVTVSTNGGCSGPDDFTGTLTVAPGTLSKGATGGGWYRVGINPPKVSMGYVVTVSTSTARVGKATVTTTTTKGQLIWVAKSGWRLKSSIGYSSTDGSAAWSSFTCPSSPVVGVAGSNPKCGSFSGTGVLQVWDPNLYGVGLGGWKTSSYGTVSFVATVYDGGQTTICKTKTTCATTQYTDYFAISMKQGTSAVGAEVPTNASPLDLVGGSIKVY